MVLPAWDMCIDEAGDDIEVGTDVHEGLLLLKPALTVDAADDAGDPMLLPSREL